MSEDVKLREVEGKQVVLLSKCIVRYRTKLIYRGGNPPLLYINQRSFKQKEKVGGNLVDLEK
jgi:hypothetical protein